MPEADATIDEPTYEGVGETDQPAEGGEGEGAGSAGEPQLVTVKIDGVEQQVPLEEAVAGYQRQQDYTRKTQEVASRGEQLAQAEQLFTALQTNPEQTLRTLFAAYGIEGLEDEGQGAGEQPDPVQQKLQEIDEFMASQRDQALRTQIEQSITGLHTQFGEFADDDLIQFAIENQMPNLDLAYRAWAFSAEQAARTAGDQKVTDTKGNLPPVAGGHGVGAGSVTEGTGAAPTTVGEAFRQAALAHGREDLVN